MFGTENNIYVKRVVEVFQDRSCSEVMHHSEFKNIQSIIKITKETVNKKTGAIKTKVEYLIANFKTNAKEFHDKILQHWSVETYHFHLDTLTMEDSHIAFVNPFSISILRGFTINLYQLFLNANKGTKIDGRDISMARIKKTALYSLEFMGDLFETKNGVIIF